MAHVLLTSTTYGTWLPGDTRGSVTSVRDYRATDPATPFRVEHDRPGEPWEPPLPGLYASAVQQLKRPAVWLTADQARAAAERMVAKAAGCGWRLHALAVMRNHFHAAVGFDGYVDVKRILAAFKAYASAGLNEGEGKPQRWWTRGGSTRVLRDERAIAAARHYVLHKQPHPLVCWSPDEGWRFDRLASRTQIEPRTE